ncbi:MAG: hypothetical protein C4523_11120 [Myxococcales bacterium]|nr:MAG: hypothetical protein C4523_11120 [Myxococcales bacterium]
MSVLVWSTALCHGYENEPLPGDAGSAENFESQDENIKLPWTVNQPLFGPWKIEKIERRKEFVRLTIGNSQASTVVEIAKRRADHRNPWMTEEWIVQPAPQAQPPEALLGFIFNELKSMEAAGKIHFPEPPTPASLGLFHVGDRIKAWEIVNVIEKDRILLTLKNGALEYDFAATLNKASPDGLDPAELLDIQPLDSAIPADILASIPLEEMKHIATCRLLKNVGFSLPNSPYFHYLMTFFGLCTFLLALDGLRQGGFSRKRFFLNVLFSVIALLPLLVVGALLADLLGGVDHVNTNHPQAALCRLEERLANPPINPLKTNVNSREANYYSRTYNKNIPLPFGESRKNIYVFGGSSVVLPEKNTFADQLQKLLSNGASEAADVYNFGEIELDSFDVRSRVSDSFGFHLPDIVIVYAGHNDIEHGYSVVLLDYSFFRQTDLLDPLFQSIFSRLKDTSGALTFGNPDAAYSVFRRLDIESPLFQFFQSIGRFAPPEGLFEKANEKILASYQSNIEAVIDEASALHIPVIISTVVGNFYYSKQVGVGYDAEWYNALALNEQNYNRRLGYFQKARDAEIFNGHLHAKSFINDYLRSISRPGVHLVDLEATMIAQRRPFNHEDFMDTMHLTPTTHHFLAQLLYEKIMEKNLLGEAPASGQSPPLPNP